MMISKYAYLPAVLRFGSFFLFALQIPENDEDNGKHQQQDDQFGEITENIHKPG
jgi:hypothetical protein